MDWNTIILHVVDGPGAGLTFMVLGFFGLIIALSLIGADKRRKNYQERRDEQERNQSIELMKSQLARLVAESRDMAASQKQIADSVARKDAVIEAEIAT